ncbi:DUF3298 domain-containing protein [Desulfitobacterium sp. Sab5]|uniref:DUF3298 and DUF4163 domain-containing protein n=1 Tax=Desulfitobacterium nosdiversum TaxID=3375356 RepID=UPI003CF3BA36
MHQDIMELKRQYDNVPIPKELDFVVHQSLKKGLRKLMFKESKGIIAIAAIFILFIGGINISPKMANALEEIPVIKSLVHVFTFREYKHSAGTFNTDIKVPALDGLENKTLQNSLNQKYLEENQKLYEQFMSDMKEMKDKGTDGHLGVNSGYVVKTDNDRILSIGRYVVNTVGSSSTKFKYDTVDKKNQILITLPSLFKEDNYIDIISDNIKAQMLEQMKQDPKKTYWISGYSNSPIQAFAKIAKNQNFYINNEGKLVISFDKYEVAPGSMGVVEFIIPTEVISDILVSHEYIQ